MELTMPNDELLKNAQAALDGITAGHTPTEASANALQSIAASLLVIARGNVPATPQYADGNQFHMVDVTADNAEVLHFTCANFEDCPVMSDLFRRLGTTEWLKPGVYIATQAPGRGIEYDQSTKEPVRGVA